MAYSREQIVRAAIEMADLETEHGSDFEMILQRDGIEIDDIAQAATGVARSTVAHWLAKDPTVTEQEQALIFGATVAGFVRGFGTALQVRRKAPDS
jgi:hypothetical protein